MQRFGPAWMLRESQAIFIFFRVDVLLPADAHSGSLRSKADDACLLMTDLRGAWRGLQAGTQDVNFLYSLAWIDRTGGHLVVSAPDTGGRFYELQFVDVYNEVPLLIGGCRLRMLKLSRRHILAEQFRGQ